MSREIKFRAWDREDKVMSELTSLHLGDHAPTVSAWVPTYNDQTKLLVFGENADLMQFTGLKDKNSLKELYEGDIIDADGNLKGNIYESPQIYEEGTDCLIEGMGTEKWRSTESIAVGRGCKYSK